MSGDLGIFVYQPVEQIATSEVKLGWRRSGGSDLSGAAWLSARCGRWWLKCSTYSVSTAVRWRRLMIQCPVQQFAAEGSDPSFGDRVRLGRPHRCAQDSNTLAGEQGIKSASELAVAVPALLR